MKNKFIKNSLFILSALLLSCLIECFIFNGTKMFNIGKDKGTISLKDQISLSNEVIKYDNKNDKSVYNVIEESDDFVDEQEFLLEPSKVDNEITLMKAEFDKKYVDRIFIKYKTDVDIKLPIRIKTFNEYGDPVYKYTYVTFLKEFTSLTKVVEKQASEVSILLTEKNNIDIKDIGIKNEFSFNIYRFILLSIFMLTITLLFIFRKTVFKRLEYLFLIIALCTGLSCIFITPCLTMYSWDDQVHLDNMYSLFDSNEVKTSIAFDYSRNLRLYMNNTQTSYEEINNIHNYLNKNTIKTGEGIYNSNKFISYTNYTYIPSAIIIQISKFLKLPYTIMFYLGKIVNLLVYVGIMFYAIKKAKIGKKLLFVLALLPSTIFLASQYSRDAIIAAGIYLAISTFLNCYCNSDKMDRKNLLIFVLSILLASFSKMIYAPMLLLILIMPKDKFTEKKNAKWIKLLIVILVLIAISTFVLPTINSNSNTIGDVRGGNVSTGSQLSYIKEQPASFARIFSRFVIGQLSSQFTYNQTLGRWHNLTIINGLSYYLLLIIIVLCAVCSAKDEKIDKIDKKLRFSLILLSIFIICLICGSMYLSFTPVGYGTVLGVQSRYYIPLLFSTYIVFKQSKLKSNFDDEKVMKVISVILLIIYFTMIYGGIFMKVAA